MPWATTVACSCSNRSHSIALRFRRAACRALRPCALPCHSCANGRHSLKGIMHSTFHTHIQAGDGKCMLDCRNLIEIRFAKVDRRELTPSRPRRRGRHRAVRVRSDGLGEWLSVAQDRRNDRQAHRRFVPLPPRLLPSQEQRPLYEDDVGDQAYDDVTRVAPDDLGDPERLRGNVGQGCVEAEREVDELSDCEADCQLRVLRCRNKLGGGKTDQRP